MRLVHRDFERDGGGSLVLIPEESEDMWHIYNLLMEGDHVRASTIRYLHKWHHVWPCVRILLGAQSTFQNAISP